MTAVTFDAAPKTAARRRERWANGRTYISAGLIFIWCLLPFYWMLVPACRVAGFPFASTLFFTLCTWSPFTPVFSESLG